MTVRVPSIPDSRWPGIEQKKTYSPGSSSAVAAALSPPVTVSLWASVSESVFDRHVVRHLGRVGVVDHDLAGLGLEGVGLEDQVAGLGRGQRELAALNRLLVGGLLGNGLLALLDLFGLLGAVLGDLRLADLVLLAARGRPRTPPSRRPGTS